MANRRPNAGETTQFRLDYIYTDIINYEQVTAGEGTGLSPWDCGSVPSCEFFGYPQLPYILI